MKLQMLLPTVALLVAACSSPAPPAAAPRVVLVAPAGMATAGRPEFAGLAISTGHHEIASEDGGRIVALLVGVGDRVRAGQLLARIDAEPARQAMADAAARLAAARAIAADRAGQAQRADALLASGAGSAATAEGARAAATAAAADVRAAAAALALARRRLALADVRAPASGVISARLAERSAILAPGARLFDLEADGGGTEILVAAPAGAGDWPAEWTVRTGSRHWPARLAGHSPAIDALGVQQLRLRLIGGRLPAGASVRAQPQAAALAQAVPMAAVVAGAGGRRVIRFVDARDQVGEVPASLIALADGQAIVRAALPPGARVISAGAAFVHPGERVRPRELA